MRSAQAHGVGTPPPKSPRSRPTGTGGRGGNRSALTIGALVLAAVNQLVRPTIPIIARTLGRTIRHTRKVCQRLVGAGILTYTVQKVTGRNPVRVYAVSPKVREMGPRDPFPYDAAPGEIPSDDDPDIE